MPRITMKVTSPEVGYFLLTDVEDVDDELWNRLAPEQRESWALEAAREFRDRVIEFDYEIDEG